MQMARCTAGQNAKLPVLLLSQMAEQGSLDEQQGWRDWYHVFGSDAVQLTVSYLIVNQYLLLSKHCFGVIVDVEILYNEVSVLHIYLYIYTHTLFYLNLQLCDTVLFKLKFYEPSFQDWKIKLELSNYDESLIKYYCPLIPQAGHYLSIKCVSKHLFLSFYETPVTQEHVWPCLLRNKNRRAGYSFRRINCLTQNKSQEGCTISLPQYLSLLTGIGVTPNKVDFTDSIRQQQCVVSLIWHSRRLLSYSWLQRSSLTLSDTVNMSVCCSYVALSSVKQRQRHGWEWLLFWKSTNRSFPERNQSIPDGSYD